MSSDRARISYDAGQLYRSVVMQQGRVTLEADWNEAQHIASEEAREEALDFVGPAGTPDDGYAISIPGGLDPFDFQIGPGTMYVGGERAFLPATIQYSAQPDWLDKANDPDFVPVGEPQTGSDYVFLFLREQEVGAVEDFDLKDVALGGPDSAQRTRLIQHIERTPISASDCASAFDQMMTNWTSQGLTFDKPTMRLLSNASLKVGFIDSGGTASPCDPVAKGGYLGADNQLIRVQISDPDPEGGRNTLLWGLDDASFMYRVDVVDPNTIKLQAAPIDAEHQPRVGQAVELLMAGAQLGNGEFVAAPTGFVVTLTIAYNPDARTISLPTAIPAIYGTGNPADPHPPRVFLRVWEQQLPVTANSPVVLGDTGVEVTLQSSDGGFHKGFFWMFAVRPNTPQQVYPERYLAGPQPPDGPREWACPLAVINWLGAAPAPVTSTSPPVVQPIIDDCRQRFNNLVELTSGLVSQVLARGSYGRDILLHNGDTLTGSDLARGLRVLLNRGIDPASATGAACFVSLELPYVVSLELPYVVEQQTVGFQPIILGASVIANRSTVIAWNPVPSTQRYLANLANQLPTGTGRLLARLTVKRDFLQLANRTADATAQANLFPPPRADFSMWFQVQPSGAYGSASLGIGGSLI
jgi:hypothetical protein